MFCEEIENYLKKSSIIINNNLLLDTLLNQTFDKVLSLIKNSKFDQKINLDNKKTRDNIKILLDHKDSKKFLNTNIECCLSKSFAFFKYDPVSGKTIKQISLNSLWTIDTYKCVDATPLIKVNGVENDDLKIQVYIGSHSGKFLCANALTGQLKWSFEASGRIESSSCLDKSGTFVIFGNKIKIGIKISSTKKSYLI